MYLALGFATTNTSNQQCRALERDSALERTARIPSWKLCMEVRKQITLPQKTLSATLPFIISYSGHRTQGFCEQGFCVVQRCVRSVCSTRGRVASAPPRPVRVSHDAEARVPFRCKETKETPPHDHFSCGRARRAQRGGRGDLETKRAPKVGGFAASLRAGFSSFRRVELAVSWFF